MVLARFLAKRLIIVAGLPQQLAKEIEGDTLRSPSLSPIWHTPKLGRGLATIIPENDKS
jgi:hypothetical protein